MSRGDYEMGYGKPPLHTRFGTGDVRPPRRKKAAGLDICGFFDEKVLAYASYARGQKSGGINMSGLPVYPAGVFGHANGDPILEARIVKPEHNTTIEAGFKARLMGNALNFNLNGFYTRVTDFQANVVDNAAVIALRSYLANIPKVTEGDRIRCFGADRQPFFITRIGSVFRRQVCRLSKRTLSDRVDRLSSRQMQPDRQGTSRTA